MNNRPFKLQSAGRTLALAFLMIWTLCLQAQPAKPFIDVSVVPDHADWRYQPGENARFLVSVTQSGAPVPVEKVRYAVMPEKMPAQQEGDLKLDKGLATINGGTMKGSGFLRCEVFATVNGKEYKGLGTAAYAPDQIQPTVEDPADFEAFWNAGKAELAGIPIDPKMTLMPERCNEKVNVYHVSFRNIKNSRIYGILCVPTGEGKFPALLQVPGAGIRPYFGDIANAEKGVITLQIGIHGIPVNLDPGVYQDLASGPLNNYPAFNLDDRDAYYYKRVYLGCVRAVDFLVGLPQYDGKTLGVTGGSQGGALSVITTALDSRIQYLAAYYPALSDMTGYLHQRAGGWPHLFTARNMELNNKPDKIKTVGYYDVVNFARRVKVPGWYSFGYNDETCPPTSMYAVFNVIKAPKEYLIVPETGHWTYPEQRDQGNAWIVGKLK